MKDSDWFDSINREWGTLEKWAIKEITDQGNPIFFGFKPFEYLWENKLLIPKDIIRTNIQEGDIDEHYLILENGNVQGIPADTYSGKKGSYSPREILNLNYANNGWTLQPTATKRILLTSKL